MNKGMLARFNSIYKMLGNDLDKIEAEYKPFEDNDKYVEQFIINKKRDKEQLFAQKIEQHKRFIDEAVNVHLSKDLEPNAKVIGSLEYQTRLANTLTLLNMAKGKVDTKTLDFIVEAKDSNTMEAIRTAYPTDEVLVWETSNNPKYQIEELTKRANSIKGAMDPMHIMSAHTRNAVLDTLK